MQTNRVFRGPLIAVIGALAVSAAPAPAEACTRVLYVAKDGTVITGLAMDWGEDMMSNM
jgi:choloylglycine hydrolase